MNNDIKVGDTVVVNKSCVFDGLHDMRGKAVAVTERTVLFEKPDGMQWLLRRTSVSPVTEAAPDPAPKPLLPHDSAERKRIPLYSVLFGYFPDAMVALAKHAYESNEKHNPGEELHWSRGKSDDHADAALRHLAEGDYVGLLWRAAALLQLQKEGEGHAVAPLAR